MGAVAELNQPSDVTVEQFDIHAQSAVVHGVGERAGECPAEQHVVVQADAADQREVTQVGMITLAPPCGC